MKETYYIFNFKGWNRCMFSLIANYWSSFASQFTNRQVGVMGAAKTIIIQLQAFTHILYTHSNILVGPTHTGGVICVGFNMNVFPFVCILFVIIEWSMEINHFPFPKLGQPKKETSQNHEKIHIFPTIPRSSPAHVGTIKLNLLWKQWWMLTVPLLGLHRAVGWLSAQTESIPFMSKLVENFNHVKNHVNRMLIHT